MPDILTATPKYKFALFFKPLPRWRHAKTSKSSKVLPASSWDLAPRYTITSEKRHEMNDGPFYELITIDKVSSFL